MGIFPCRAMGSDPPVPRGLTLHRTLTPISAAKVLLIASYFMTVLVHQNESVDVAWSDPRRPLRPSIASRKQLQRIIVDLNINPAVPRTIPAHVFIQSNRNAPVLATGVTGLLTNAGIASITIRNRVVVDTVSLMSVVNDSCPQGFGQPECQQRFSRNLDAFAARQDLSPVSCCCSSACADGCSFATACDSAYDRSDHSSATDIFTGTFIGSNAFSGFRFKNTLLGVNAIALPVDHNRIEIQCYFLI